MGRIKVICYGKAKNWNSRKEAMAFYEDCIMNSEGSERDRYTQIYFQLKGGSMICSDE